MEASSCSCLVPGWDDLGQLDFWQGHRHVNSACGLGSVLTGLWEGASREQAFHESDAHREASWLFLTLCQKAPLSPQIQGERAQSPPLARGRGNSHWRRACRVGPSVDQPAHLWNIPSTTHWLSTTRVAFLLIQSLLWIRAILQSKCPPAGFAMQAAASILQLLGINSRSHTHGCRGGAAWGSHTQS